MDNLKYCKYYKGEVECPFKMYSSAFHFWHFEEQYWNHSNFDHNMFEDVARCYITNNKDKDNYMTSDAPIEQKGFVMFAEAMLQKWMPHNVDIIFKY